MSIPVTSLVPTCTEFEIPVKSSYGGDEAERIPARRWGDESSGCVSILVHGLGAHSGWFEPYAKSMAARGHRLYSFDLSGFGKSSHRNFKSFRQWQEDLIQVFEHVGSEEGNKPLVLTGNSMGSILAVSTIDRLAHAPASLVLMSPGFGGYPDTFTLPYKVKAILTAFLNPTKVIELPYGVEEITACEEIRKQVKEDKLGKFAIPAFMGLELLKLTNESIAKGKQLPSSLPIYMATAGKELIVDNRLNEKFFTNLESEEKNWQKFEQSFHDLVFESSREEMVDGVDTWLRRVIGP